MKHTGIQKRRPLWPLMTAVTLAAMMLYISREQREVAWAQELGVFVGSWVCIALFAMLGRVLFRRRRD